MQTAHHVDPAARVTRLVHASAAERVDAPDRRFVLSAGTRLLLIGPRPDPLHGELAEVEPLDGPHEGERLLVFPENVL